MTELFHLNRRIWQSETFWNRYSRRNGRLFQENVLLKATNTKNNSNVVARYYMDYIRGMQRLPRVVRVDAGTENVITRELQIFSDDAILMKCTGKRFHTGTSVSNQRIEMMWSFFMKTFTHFFWRNLFKHLRDSVFINHSNVLTLYFVFYFILPSVLLPAINTTANSFVYTMPCIVIAAV